MDVEEKLDALTKEYQEFVYIVSHDFNAPLRHIKQFSHLLLESVGEDDLNDDQKTYVDFIKKSIDKLENMHEAMLTLSRVNTHGGDFVVVNSQDIVDNAVANLKDEIQEVDVTVNYNGLPSVYADPKQLEVVFYHLIENALKYHNGGVQITITAQEQGEAVCFTVEDNGIGLAEEYYEQVFTMFRRLHTPEEYGGGLGIGLALVKRIIDRHDGKIQIQSSHSGGVKVMFSLPKKA